MYKTSHELSRQHAERINAQVHPEASDSEVHCVKSGFCKTNGLQVVECKAPPPRLRTKTLHMWHLQATLRIDRFTSQKGCHESLTDVPWAQRSKAQQELWNKTMQAYENQMVDEAILWLCIHSDYTDRIYVHSAHVNCGISHPPTIRFNMLFGPTLYQASQIEEIIAEIFDYWGNSAMHAFVVLDLNWKRIELLREETRLIQIVYKNQLEKQEAIRKQVKHVHKTLK